MPNPLRAVVVLALRGADGALALYVRAGDERRRLVVPAGALANALRACAGEVWTFEVGDDGETVVGARYQGEGER